MHFSRIEMVLIGNNNSSLSIETFHKNRCIEKAEIKDITVQRKYEQAEKEQSNPTPNQTNNLKPSATNK